MDEQRNKESVKQMSFVQKLSHFWYYYKWYVLVGGVFLITLIICLVQCTSKRNPDAMIMCAGNYAIPAEFHKDVDKALSQVMSKDYNGDGYKTCDLMELTILMGENASESDVKYAITEQKQMWERFQIELSMGSSVIYLLDKSLYDAAKYNLVPLKDVLGYTPKNAYDEYGIVIKELDAYRYTDLKNFPSDYVLCIRKRRESSLVKGSDTIDYYNNNVKYFCDLINFRNEKAQ